MLQANLWIKAVKVCANFCGFSDSILSIMVFKNKDDSSLIYIQILLVVVGGEEGDMLKITDHSNKP